MAEGIASPSGGAASQAPKNPILSAILSLIIPGLGQIINGQVKKGLVLLVGFVVLWFVILIAYLFGGTIAAVFSGGLGLCCCLPVFLVPFLVNLYAAYDAYKVANDLNSGIFAPDWLS
jgi:hypothetical protein